ncbi:hypothetical protein I4F81_009795 [Pyropia yezoensis]|uniref:Uncharacterized protein n=1 Tax=Pyropia yezoensis TaxID=2788 RepID=A0ACC3CBV4_PYRYE|nr:hypothetical protein I4F81_009795 [Neopyropia yezoensis]
MEGIRATRLSVGVRETGRPHRVAANDVARLMYYLHCVTVGLGMDVLPDHLVEDTRWARLTAADTDAVYRAALELSPDQFLHTVLFPTPLEPTVAATATSLWSSPPSPTLCRSP